ncbi:MAG: type IV secretory system conjugative DNA transfer family protein [Firmicutes bacterium]|nr:type IV secretory system conjugative DNA transfer family protein [Bacillota bacterium]
MLDNQGLDVQQLIDIYSISATNESGIYLGKGDRGYLFAPKECGVLVLGPPRSGKTTSVIIPNVLTANSAVIVTSTKHDVVDQTYLFRSRIAPCYIFDPTQSASFSEEITSIGWSPLDNANQFDRALLTAKSMVLAARPDSNRGEAQHWTQKATELLATLLHAASLSKTPFSEALSWLNRHDGSLALRILDSSAKDSEVAFDVLSGILNTDFREQSGIWSTASSVCACYQNSRAIANTELPRVDYKSLLEEKSTVYVVASGENQQLLAPVIAGFIGDMKRAAYAINVTPNITDKKEYTGHPAKLLLILDELANIAPLHDLPEIIAEGGSQGVTTLACLQDLSQARRRWPVVADGFFSLFHTKFILPGLGDRQTLENISLLCGEKDEIVFSKTSHHKKSDKKLDSKTASIRKVKKMPVDIISRGEEGKALLIMGSAVGGVNLTPSYNLRNVISKEFSLSKNDNFGLLVKKDLSSKSSDFNFKSQSFRTTKQQNTAYKRISPSDDLEFEQLTFWDSNKIKHAPRKSTIFHRDRPGGSRSL